MEAIDIGNSMVVFIELKHSVIAPVSLELLSKAKELSEFRKSKLISFCIGKKTEDRMNVLSCYGIDEAYFAEREDISIIDYGLYGEIFGKFILTIKPEIVLIGATILGRSMAPYIAGKIGTGLTADCIRLSIDPENQTLLQTRPAFGGELFATIKCIDSRPQMCTVRPNVFEAISREHNANMQVYTIKPDIEPTKIRLLEKEISHTLDNPIETSKIIIGIGRGANYSKNKPLIDKLASMLNATIGATRAVVEDGLFTRDVQIGQTGKTVKPKLYIAIGISGAVQHISGLMNTKYVIAIDKNKEAPIFKYADYGLIGDTNEVLPRLVEYIEKKAGC